MTSNNDVDDVGHVSDHNEEHENVVIEELNEKEPLLSDVDEGIDLGKEDESDEEDDVLFNEEDDQEIYRKLLDANTTFFGKLQRYFGAYDKETMSHLEKKYYVKVRMRKLIIYLIVLSLLLLIGILPTDKYHFEFYDSVMNHLMDPLKPRFDIEDEDLVPNFETLFSYLKVAAVQYALNYSLVPDHTDYIGRDNVVLGLTRLRQIRAEPENCKSIIMSKIFMDCNGSKEAEKPLTPTGHVTVSKEAWTWKSSDETKEMYYQSQFEFYSGGGYTIDLPLLYEDAVKVIEELQENRWLDEKTRAVFLTFTMYNPNINLFVNVNELFEQSPTGKVKSYFDVEPAKLLRYLTTSDYFLLVCEVIYVLFFIYSLIEEIVQISSLKLKYFKTLWNYFDLATIILNLCYIYFNVYREILVKSQLKSLMENPNQYWPFTKIIYWQKSFERSIALLIGIYIVRIFQYTSFSLKMNLLILILKESIKDLMGYTLVYVLLFISFIQAGYLLFGTLDNNFRSLSHSGYGLFRMILGDFSLEDMIQVNFVLGPTFFLVFYFLFFFVLFNMLIAILNLAYAVVSEDLKKRKSEIAIKNLIKKIASDSLNRVTNKKATDLLKMLKVTGIYNSKYVSFNDWRNTLKSRGMLELELTTVFQKYDKDNDLILNLKEKKNLIDDLEMGHFGNERKLEDDVEIDLDELNNDDGGLEKLIMDTNEIEDLKKRADQIQEKIGLVVGELSKLIKCAATLQEKRHERQLACLSKLRQL